MAGLSLRSGTAAEIILALRLHRGQRWIGLVRSRNAATLREWVDGLATWAMRDESPEVITLPRSPGSWERLLSTESVLVLSGLSVLAETRSNEFSESSPSFKAASLLRALGETRRLRCILLVEGREAELLGREVPELDRLISTEHDADAAPPGGPSQSLRPLSPSHTGMPIMEELTRRRDHCRQLLDAHPPSGAAHLVAETRLWLGQIELLLDAPDRATRLIAAAAQPPDFRGRISRAYESLGDLHLVRGNPAGALGAYERALTAAVNAEMRGSVQRLNLLLGDAATRLGRFEDALRYFERARSLGGEAITASGDEPTRLEAAIRQARDRLDDTDETEDAHSRARALTTLGRQLSMAGNDQEAAERLEAGAEILGELGRVDAQAAALHDGGLALARAGDLDRAIELHDRALEALAGRVDTLREDLGLARGGLFSVAGAADVGRSEERRLTQAALLRSLAALYERKGDREKAQEFRRRAE
ncbi:MAG: tetratricopeptide repeat protein [Armatimonadia bacterium]|nr:tetratricopeptide repeat protein [Armatimonadia bacterium]